MEYGPGGYRYESGQEKWDQSVPVTTVPAHANVYLERNEFQPGREPGIYPPPSAPIYPPTAAYPPPQQWGAYPPPSQQPGMVPAARGYPSLPAADDQVIVRLQPIILIPLEKDHAPSPRHRTPTTPADHQAPLPSLCIPFHPLPIAAVAVAALLAAPSVQAAPLRLLHHPPSPPKSPVL